MKVVIIGFSFLVALTVGVGIGWWANSPGLDFLCSKPSVYKLGQNVEAEGIQIKAGTLIDLRACEYANRFSVNLYYEKGFQDELFIPYASVNNIGNHGANQYRIKDMK